MKKLTVFNPKALLVVALGAAMSLAASVPAMAAAVDVDDIVTDIGAQLVPIGLIGGAVLLIFVAVKAFRWVRKALA
ncbi:MAG: major capsid protein [Ramlibacter sp.]